MDYYLQLKIVLLVVGSYTVAMAGVICTMAYHGVRIYLLIQKGTNREERKDK